MAFLAQFATNKSEQFNPSCRVLLVANKTTLWSILLIIHCTIKVQLIFLDKEEITYFSK
jgi:hypothetical protein